MTKFEDEWHAVATSVYDTLLVGLKDREHMDALFKDDHELAIGLEDLAWMSTPFNDDFELALLELTSRDVRLTGTVYEKWLKIWHTHQIVMDDTEPFSLARNLEVCFKEKTVSMTRNLLKKDRQGLTPLNLGQVAEPVCVKNDSFRVAANRIQKRVAVPMGELMAWTVSCDMREVDGKSQPRKWKIGVGPALYWFQKMVYLPLRERQVNDFVRKHGGGANQ
jgi:hypothetical protein